MTHMPQTQGFAAGGFDRRVRADRRRGDRRRLSIAVPVDRRAQDRRSNRGRRITEWFGSSGSEHRSVPGRRAPTPSRVTVLPLQKTASDANVLQEIAPGDTVRETCKPEVGSTDVDSQVQQESTTLAPSFTTLTFEHRGRSYTVEAVEEPSLGVGHATWHWRIMVNGVVEHTLRAMPHEDRASLETRAIRTLEDTAAGAVRELQFEYEGKRYHLEDRSDKLRRESSGDTGMWCVTCDGVMEGSFQAKAGESKAVLRARAIQIARRSGEYQATLRSNYRPTRGRALRQHMESAPRRVSRPTPSPTPAAQDKTVQTPRAQVQPATNVRSVPAPPSAPVQTRVPDTPAPSTQGNGNNGRQPNNGSYGPQAAAQAPVPPRVTHARKLPVEPNASLARKVQSSGNATSPMSRPHPIPHRISGPTAAVAKTEPAAITTVGRSISATGRAAGRTLFGIAMGTVALVTAVALMPFYAVRRGGRPRHRSRLVRRVHEWVDAAPLRMLLPYAAGATLALGLVPLNATIWAAGGMAAILLFPIRVKGRSEKFEIAQHVYDRTRTVSPAVQVHSKKKGLDDPRRVTRRRRSTSSHRLLRSAGQ